MEEEDKQPHKTGLPEALDPAIGNTSIWEANPYFQNLRTIDPTKDLESSLIDPSERDRILENWAGPLNSPLHNEESIEDLPHVPEEIIEKPKDKGKKKHKKTHSVAKARETEPEWLQEEIAPIEQEAPVPADTSIDLPVEDSLDIEATQAEKPGKRVRKAVKVAEQERKKTIKAKTVNPPFTMESTLSPFTRWLKGLRGSEYVHPYEDDYGLDQRTGGSKDGISETFADLLAAQGYRDQAIDMYKLLMAKYPEKSSFFAAKIEAL